MFPTSNPLIVSCSAELRSGGLDHPTPMFDLVAAHLLGRASAGLAGAATFAAYIKLADAGAQRRFFAKLRAGALDAAFIAGAVEVSA